MNSPCSNCSCFYHLPVESEPAFEYKIPVYQDIWPTSTIIACIFVALSFLIIAILKVTFSSTDHFLADRNDLVIFKPSQKNQLIVGRKMFENNQINQHNIKVTSESGFDMRCLNRPSLSILRRTTRTNESKYSDSIDRIISNGNIRTGNNALQAIDEI